ncbi:MAG TPA: hypothetical protein VEF76_15080, partial [Patescibacteria group bacterium]|nr:hypothetical protein [Patescibacteria group bacterium]
MTTYGQMTDEEHIDGIFNTAADEAVRGVFEEALFQKFGDRATAKLVVEKMALLQIPLPNEPEQFLMGQEGLLVFSNPHGVIIRIEKQDGKGYENSERAHHSGWMIQPLGAVEAGKALIEIVPGVHAENREAPSRELFWKMWSDGYYLWDERPDNTGRLPAVPELPGADTVVNIDRMSVQRLSGSTGVLQRALEVLKGENNRFSFRSARNDPQPVLGDLRAE